jgi:hypothetical protein
MADKTISQEAIAPQVGHYLVSHFGQRPKSQKQADKNDIFLISFFKKPHTALPNQVVQMCS